MAFAEIKKFLNSFGSDVVRVATFKTDKPRSAVQTACRAMGLSSDIGLYLSSMIPIDRGTPRTIEQTYYGDEEEGFLPVTEFKKQIDRYEGLLEMAINIQGLVCGRGTHSCGVVISDNLIRHTATMRAPNGEPITQYDLEDCERSGLIKYDWLLTKTLGTIQLTFESLIEAGHIKWQGSLRETYNKYIHPDVIDYDNPDYFEKLNKHELIGVFQFESGAGLKALNTIKPHSLIELAAANTLMRLQAEGEQPIERYVRIKNNPQEFEDELLAYGLNEEERAVIHEHLDKEYGTCSSQEMLMLLSMDKRISGFGVPEANILRKAVAKKKPAVLEKAKNLFFDMGHKLGTRQVMLDYIWNVQFHMQFGYAFSQLHTDGYSLIAIQQLELITSYPKIYWETALLQVESGAIEVEGIDEDSEGREKGTNYGKLGGAIATLQKQGVKIELPNINTAQNGFVADEKNNAILYGLKGITSINNKTAELIAKHRPYTSMKDFHDRLHLVKEEIVNAEGKVQSKALISKEQMLSLIKAGCFDVLEPDKTRLELLEEFLHWEFPDKVGLTSSNIKQLLKRGLIPDEYEEALRYYNFRTYLKEGVKVDDGVLQQDNPTYKVTKSKKWYLLDGEDEVDTQEIVEIFFEMFPELQEEKHWVYNDNPDFYANAIWVEAGSTGKASFEGVYKTKITPITRLLQSKELLQQYNEALFTEVKNDHIKGTESTWEMQTMCYYYGEHELAHLDRDYYKVDNFFELDEEPVVEDYWQRKDKETGEIVQIPKFKINQLVGVVLDRNKNKHTVTLLTEFGSVDVKFPKGSFTHYDQTISIQDEETGKKRIVERSWFSRGNLLFIRGIRNDDQFRTKTYKNGIYEHSVALITKVYDDGIVLTQNERTKPDAE